MQRRSHRVHEKKETAGLRGSMDGPNKIEGFYYNYHGHTVEHLQEAYTHIKSLKPHGSIVYFAGDSSLDNKHWFTDKAKAVNGYEKFLQPPMSIQDIAYWLNKEIVERGVGKNMTALNCSIEESTVEGRWAGTLMEQDKFIKDHIGAEDILVLSVGGNDIALRPQCCTICSALCLAHCATTSCVRHSCGYALPCDDICYGFGFGCLSNFCAFPCGFGYLKHLFGTRVQNVASNIISPNQAGGNALVPKKVLVCMIYYLDEQETGSWADKALGGLGYNKNPEHLQEIIKQLFIQATSKVDIPGVEVVPVPLFVALDGKHTSDYAARVEPSASGGKKMGKLLMDAIEGGKPAMEAAMYAFEDRLKRRNNAGGMTMSR